MADGPSRGFTEDTNATPLARLSDLASAGPRRPCLVVIAGPRLGEIYPIEGEILIGRDPEAAVRLTDDESVSRRHAKVRATESGAHLADLGSSNGTFVDGEKVGELVLEEGAKIRVGQTVVLKYALYDAVEENAQRQLLEAALRDGLTHAFNRRYFVQRLAAEIRFAERHAQTLALLMIDVDHFKQLNDQHGHLAGDGALKRLVEILAETLRAEDVLARYGGEEFAVLVRGVTLEHACGLGERLRRLVETGRFDATSAGDPPLQVTVSVGVAGYPFAPDDAPTDPSERLIALADAALYRAKLAGRNQVQS